MKLRKTPINKRFRQNENGTIIPVYTIYFDNGDKVIYEPGKAITFYAKTGKTIVQYDDEITESIILKLHKEDDSEVEKNLNHVHCETRGMRKEREQNKKKWYLEHPNEDPNDNPFNPKYKLLSFDFKPSDDFDEDHSEIEYQASKNQLFVTSFYDVEDLYENESETIDRINLIREFVSTLPKSQQELYSLIYIDGLSQKQICEMLNLSKSTVSERCKRLEKTLFKKFKK